MADRLAARRRDTTPCCSGGPPQLQEATAGLGGIPVAYAEATAAGPSGWRSSAEHRHATSGDAGGTLRRIGALVDATVGLELGPVRMVSDVRPHGRVDSAQAGREVRIPGGDDRAHGRTGDAGCRPSWSCDLNIAPRPGHPATPSGQRRQGPDCQRANTCRAGQPTRLLGRPTPDAPTPATMDGLVDWRVGLRPAMSAGASTTPSPRPTWHSGWQRSRSVALPSYAGALERPRPGHGAFQR